jgi:glutathione synthase
MYLSNLPPNVRARTLVSRSPEHLRAFLRELDGPAVLMPLGASGGEKTFYVRRRQVANVNQMIDALVRKGFAVAQEYLPEAEQGEKRVLLLGGRPVRLGDRTAIYRRPSWRPRPRSAAGGGRAGDREGRRRACAFGPVEERLCEILRPRLIADRLYLATADLVGDKILSLNVFTPAGFHTLRELYGVDVADLVIRDVERRVRLRGAYRSRADPEATEVV